ncbi:SLATT domain-containing protein [Labilibaculum sp. A4]|uniref:SLATT domain-containing protein n=1 Tax=Labilibaculum euxinus TaxID=2686357 RepID=UPI000F61C6DC|nr:SLATT domain-containing protein [Labilibaculum euxinus]MDQ1770764.1 SLATT domain-containing protein [Labilibaculum euxinus]MWN75935.1 SLATT domain-containing protein [Labilibaculum euxinus]
MKKTTYDRKLVGPDSYEYFNDLSKLCQARYLLILKWQLILLLSIAIISSIPELPEIYTKIKHLIELVLILTVLILMIVQYKSNYMDGWQKSRFLAESILSSSWLLLFKIDIYDSTWNNALTLFHKRIQEMKSEITVDDYLKFVTQKSNDNDSPIWIKDNFDIEIKDKVEFYIRERINDQEAYYYKKTKYNTRQSLNYFWFGVGAMGLGALLTVLTIANIIPEFSYLGLFTTISASLFSWKQTKRFEELSSTYSVAVEELKDFKKKLLLDNSEVRVKEIIYDTEKSISREHKLWVSKIGD